ncbi:MAG TPA: histidine kinase dimerization/phosphoacceptor domain -containing protein [Kofleriaceae bacterium]|nr:histidine kinase dimerization/phosphoacceptor domain -containing protein [Kofleriaceae bacterium]
MMPPRPAPSPPPAHAESDLETRFRTMADHAPVLLWMAGADARCDYFNQGWLRFTGRPLEDEVGSGWAAGIHPEDFQRCMHTYMDSFVARRPFAMEYRLRRHDGAYRWILDQGAPRFDPDGSFVGFIGSCVDIEEQRQAREDLRRVNDELVVRVREREILLREVHHRVKNDLQVIASLLGIQARRLADEDAVAALLECQSRVETVALVHEQIYQTRDLSRIPFAPYVRRLAAGVFRALGGAGPIELAIDVDDVVLSVEEAIPCGMILHELLGNCLKHAFPRARGGHVSVGVHALPGGRLELEVADDGVGLPPGFDPAETTSVGWRLILAFVEQLDGRLELESRGGATVRVTVEVGHDALTGEKR